MSYKPHILEVAAIPNLQRSLERQDDLLNKIQKALGEYLERQRQAFSRFYFVGDEDLLEIIGNGADPMKIQRHLSKMFAGIVTLGMEETEEGAPKRIASMISREGEQVGLSTPIEVAKDSRVDAWLTKAESGMKVTLATQLEEAVAKMSGLDADIAPAVYFESIDPLPAQTCILATELSWSQEVEAALRQEADGKATVMAGLETSGKKLEAFLTLLSERVLQDLEPALRKKYEQLITAIVHERDVTRTLIKDGTASATSFEWLYHMRYYWFPQEKNLVEKLKICMASATFFYGFEYLGVGDRLVQTPLTDACYLTLTQALHIRQGGNPFGPAGTGKTESVKALGAQLGRFVLVFNCDETFDFQAMGRIFVGLCQVGAWGCFDEFNRLEERILSAVSQQILLIQNGLIQEAKQIELIGKNVKLNKDIGIFVTMNPGYAGRSNLPDNLKQLFRAMAMVAPDRDLIAQVMLYSQGITTAEALSSKIVLLFVLCKDQLSDQPHYDFGLRALKSVLVSAGNLKRQMLEANAEAGTTADQSLEAVELEVLIRSMCDTVVPKLVAEDLPVYSTLLGGVFPGVTLRPIGEKTLRQHIDDVCKEQLFVPSESWVEKTLQLYQVQQLRHGVMMVGPSGSGKTSVWRVLLESMERMDGVKGESYVIDPKALGKDALYGTLDATTLEWTDGVFTNTLRTILNNVRGESEKRHWIVFDGDVDPEWAENLNSVLDDNRLLTLPSGERLQIPSNVRLMMETETLKYATPATVSRCGMVWFQDTLSDEVVFTHLLLKLEKGGLDGLEEGIAPEVTTPVQASYAELLRPHFSKDGFVAQALEFALSAEHVMQPTRPRLLLSLFSLLSQGCVNVVQYNEGTAIYIQKINRLGEEQ